VWQHSTKTEQGIGLLTISVSVAGGQSGQAKFMVASVKDSLGQLPLVLTKNRSLTTAFSLKLKLPGGNAKGWLRARLCSTR